MYIEYAEYELHVIKNPGKTVKVIQRFPNN